jgi:hypothetical protein
MNMRDHASGAAAGPIAREMAQARRTRPAFAHRSIGDVSHCPRIHLIF